MLRAHSQAVSLSNASGTQHFLHYPRSIVRHTKQAIPHFVYFICFPYILIEHFQLPHATLFYPSHTIPSESRIPDFENAIILYYTRIFLLEMETSFQLFCFDFGRHFGFKVEDVSSSIIVYTILHMRACEPL